jgi:hypothetical protein
MAGTKASIPQPCAEGTVPTRLCFGQRETSLTEILASADSETKCHVKMAAGVPDRNRTCIWVLGGPHSIH